MPATDKITRGLLPLLAGGAAAAALSPDEAEAATYPGFVKQFPKIVTRKGRRELERLGLLDENGRMYVGTLEPDIFEALKKRDHTVMDDNVWISRHAPDQRLGDGVTPEELARDIAELIDSSDTKVLRNFPTRFPERDRAKWMLAGRKGDSYTAAPLRTGEFGDVELKTVFEPQYDKKTYLDGMSWGGPRLPYMVTQAQLPEQSISQPQGLSAVSSRPMQTLGDFLSKRKMLSAAIGTGAVLYPTETAGNDDLSQTDGILELMAREGQPEGQGKNTGGGIGRGLSSGTRAVLEGLGGLAEMGPNAIANLAISPFTDYRFRNPGTAAADAMGLATPQTDAEKSAYGFVRGAAEAMPFVGGGAALAIGAGGTARQFGKWLADSPITQMAFGGLLGMLAGSGE